MTIYTNLICSGISYPDATNIQIVKTISEQNAVSNFSTDFWNTAGLHKSDFTIGNEVEIQAGSPLASASTIFKGVLEEIKFDGEGVEEKISLAGRDYSARLMDVTVEPEVYSNLPAGSIVRDIVTKYVSDIQAVTGSVADSTYDVAKIVFNQMNAYDAVKQLANLSNSIFYVDNDKYLHFEQKGSTDSGYSLGSSNVVSANFEERRETIYNAIWVYGDRYLGGYKEQFNVGSLTGSVATLLNKPHNTLVEWNGTPYKGGILNMTIGQLSGVGYLVDFDNKQIIFTSGDTWGDNIPSAGSGVITYDRDLPIVKYTQDDNSIQNYSKRVKLIVNKDIKDPNMAEELMLSELERSKDPKIQGTLKLKNITNLTPGNTIGIYLPNHNISGSSFDILEANYDFNTENNYSERVLTLTVNKKLKDVTDTIKDILLELKKIQGTDISDSDVITRYHATTGSFALRQSGCVVWTAGIGSSFILGHPVNSLLGSYASHSLGDWKTGSSIYWSGGYLT